MDPEGLPMSELKTQFITINPSDIYNILKRKGLNRRLYRLFYGQEHSDSPVVTESYLREAEKKKETHIESFCSFYLFCQDTFYVGTWTAPQPLDTFLKK